MELPFISATFSSCEFSVLVVEESLLLSQHSIHRRTIGTAFKCPQNSRMLMLLQDMVTITPLAVSVWCARALTNWSILADHFTVPNTQLSVGFSLSLTRLLRSLSSLLLRFKPYNR